MLAKNTTALTPQREEDIEQCQWINRDNTATVLSNTHPSIIDVIKAPSNSPEGGEL
jgi:hypothetical protein